MWAAKTMATGARAGTVRGAGMTAGGRPAAATTGAGRDRAAKAVPVPTAAFAVRRGPGVRRAEGFAVPKADPVQKVASARRESFAVRGVGDSAARAAIAGRCARRSRA